LGLAKIKGGLNNKLIFFALVEMLQPINATFSAVELL